MITFVMFLVQIEMWKNIAEINYDTVTSGYQINCSSYLCDAQLDVDSVSCVLVADNVLFSLSHTHRLMT